MVSAVLLRFNAPDPFSDAMVCAGLFKLTAPLSVKFVVAAIEPPASTFIVAPEAMLTPVSTIAP